MTSPQPTSNYDRYRAAVQRAIVQPWTAWSFKSDPGYREVLEHVSEAQGATFFEWIAQRNPGVTGSLIARLATLNDSVGQPVQAEFSIGHYSPSNWRYLCHAIKLWHHIDSLNLPEVDGIELGGGYGGLALYVDGLRHLFATTLRSYTIVDLPDVAELQRQVSRALGIPLNAVNGLDGNELELIRPQDATPRVLFSAYAFSEFDQDTRDWYADRLIKHCDHGLMIWNFPDPELTEDGREYGGPVYPFTDRPLTVTDDEPALYAGHKLVRW